MKYKKTNSIILSILSLKRYARQHKFFITNQDGKLKKKTIEKQQKMCRFNNNKINQILQFMKIFNWYIL